MYNLPEEIQNKIIEFKNGDEQFWKNKFNDVINEINSYNSENILSKYFEARYYNFKQLCTDVDVLLEELFPNGIKIVFVNVYLKHFKVFILQSDNPYKYDVVLEIEEMIV
jgi:hypothetical protein